MENEVNKSELSLENNSEYSSVEIFFLRLLGFLFGLIFAVGIEVGIVVLADNIFDIRLIPKGIGWILFPILGAIAGSKSAPNFKIIYSQFKKDINEKIDKADKASESKSIRIMIMAPLFWFLSVITFVYLFEPYGYMVSDDYLHMLKVMLFPVVLTFIGYFTYSKLIKS